MGLRALCTCGGRGGSVHLVCRPRPESAPIGDWAHVLRELPPPVADWIERLPASGQATALRTLLRSEAERSRDFIGLANALSALCPAGTDEKRLVDAMLLTPHPRPRCARVS